MFTCGNRCNISANSSVGFVRLPWVEKDSKRCSILSSTNSPGWLSWRVIWRMSCSLGSIGPENRSWRASAMAGTINSGELMAASGTKNTPPGKLERCVFANSAARRVLPMPPIPVRVSNRHWGSLKIRVRAANSASRPIKGLK